MAMTKKIKTVRAVTARTSPQKESLLSMRDLRVSYGDFEALHGYSLELAPGRSTALPVNPVPGNPPF